MHPSPYGEGCWNDRSCSFREDKHQRLHSMRGHSEGLREFTCSITDVGGYNCCDEELGWYEE